MLWALIILVLCGMPGKDIPHISFLELLSFDKFVHAGIFFVLILLTVRGFLLQTRFIKFQHSARSFAFVICIVYGGSLEIMQGTIFTDRSADIFDFIANSFGSVMGLVFYNWIDNLVLKKLVK
jgi:glycopeptide antibiotics resistance protein